jgi:hypothetical protein
MPPKQKKDVQPEPEPEDGAERELVEKELVIGYLKSKLGRWASQMLAAGNVCLHSHTHVFLPVPPYADTRSMAISCRLRTLSYPRTWKLRN